MLNKTQYKIILLISVFALILIFGLYQVRESEQHKIDLLLTNGQSEKGLLIDKILEFKSSSLKTFVYDYTYWDEMVSFIETRNEKWANANISASLQTYNADAVWIYNSDISLIYSACKSEEMNSIMLPLSEDNLKEIVTGSKFPHFFIKTDLGLMEIHAASVHPTNDNERKTPPRGYFLAGRLWTDAYLQEISDLTESTVKFASLEDEKKEDLSSNNNSFTINNFKILNDWNGRPLTKLHLTSSLLILQILEGQSKMQYLISIIFAVSLILLISVFIFVLVNKPLKIISSGLANNVPISNKKLLAKKDEFGRMAVALNNSFAQKDKLVKEIATRISTENELKEKDYFLNESQRVGRIGSFDLNIFTKEWKSSEIFDDILCNGNCSRKTPIGLLKLIHPGHRKELMQYFRQNTIDKKEMFNKEFRTNYTNDGKEHWVLGVGKITFDNNGKPVRMIGTIQDITERKRYEKELVKAKERAEGSDKLKDAFIANISHEIRTPLNGIIGMTELIKDSFSGQITENEMQYFKAIDQSSSRLTKTVDMILNFSRVQVGDFPVNKKNLVLPGLIENLRTTHLTAAREKSLYLEFENKCENAVVTADEYCITQAISNLIDNAIKYTETGGIVIILEDNVQGYKLHIHDTGIGISKEYLPHIFDPYTQEQSGYNRKFDGVGLGLSLVKRYLNLNGAAISVTSRKNAGSTFTIKFLSGSKRSKTETSDNHNGYIQNVQTLNSYSSEKASILIVEDDSINQMYMKAVLKKYSVKCVFTAANALDELNSKKYDLILMDISLKGKMNGLDLTQIIKADKKLSGIPVIAVTGHTSPGDIQNCYNAGCDGFLSKPFNNHELISKIELLLGKGQASLTQNL